MNNISTGKMFNYIDRILGEHKPITADVFLDNYCNNDCPYCTYKRWEFDNGARSMSLDLFKRVCDRLLELGVKGIILTGGGEPTIAKEFDGIAQYLEDNHISYGINTNFNVIKYISPKYLKVSLDGWDNLSYYRARGVYNYYDVYSNICKYAKWKRDNSPDTSLGIQILATSTEEVQSFYEANRNLPVDYISIRPMESTGGKYYTTLPKDNNYQPKEIIRTIDWLASIDPRVVKNFKWSMIGTQESSCIAQWSQIAVNEIGEVMYCCHKPYQIVGSVFDDDILNKKANAITDMAMCDIPCRLTAPNYEVAQILAERKNVEFI